MDEAVNSEGLVIDATSARQSFREIVDEATHRGRRIVITRSGRPVAALVSIRDLEQLAARDAKTDGIMIAAHNPLAEKVSFDDFRAAAGGASVGAQAQAGPSLGDVAVNLAVQRIAEAVSDKASELLLEKVMEKVAEAGGVPDEQGLRSVLEEARSAADCAEITEAAKRALACA